MAQIGQNPSQTIMRLLFSHIAPKQGSQFMAWLWPSIAGEIDEQSKRFACNEFGNGHVIKIELWHAK